MRYPCQTFCTNTGFRNTMSDIHNFSLGTLVLFPSIRLPIMCKPRPSTRSRSVLCRFIYCFTLFPFVFAGSSAGYPVVRALLPLLLRPVWVVCWHPPAFFLPSFLSPVPFPSLPPPLPSWRHAFALYAAAGLLGPAAPLPSPSSCPAWSSSPARSAHGRAAPTLSCRRPSPAHSLAPAPAKCH